MELKNMIPHRKSVRSYTGQPVEQEKLDQILAFAETLQPLYPQIRVRCRVVERENVKCLCPWTTPQVLAFYSEKAEGYLENVGFLYQQMELYLQQMGLGACWLGMGRLDPRGSVAATDVDGLDYVIMLAFGYPKGAAQRSSVAEFKRKALSAISDTADDRLEPARLAPSSVNSQPWYFTHDEDKIHVYCARQKMLWGGGLSDMNRIDIGIALAHLYVCNPETFRFTPADAQQEIKGYVCLGSIFL